MQTTVWGRGRLEREGDVIYYEWCHQGEQDRRPVVVLTHSALGEIVKVLGQTTTPISQVVGLGCPLLVIAGEEDQIFPPRLLAELAQQLGARFVQLDGVGHSPYFEDPEAYNAALLTFLEST